MCGIAGFVSVHGGAVPDARRKLATMSRLIAHRGPDGHDSWSGERGDIGLAHRRLSIIDLSKSASQPMHGEGGLTIACNGEIYNYKELQAEFADSWRFHTSSDTETILAAYARREVDCLDGLRGMFAFALWDEKRRRLFCACDRFGIKPLYYALITGRLYFASEAKALLPFLPEIATDAAALAEYLTFQYQIGTDTLFRGVKRLLPGHALVVEDGALRVWRYWDVSYEVDFDHSPRYFQSRLAELLDDSMRLHLRSDVRIGSYLSGGLDSSLVSLLAAEHAGPLQSFHGRFTQFPGYDESDYAQLVADHADLRLDILDITAADFADNIEKVIYHLDYPIAGPGSFPQYMVSKLASEHVKVVLGGQGGDEVFGGYARYLLAYFEQCIKAAIDGTYKNGHYVVTIDSIVPNLGSLREYKPLMAEFWREGLFGPLDERYFRLVDRSTDMQDEIDWSLLDKEKVQRDFRSIFNNSRNVRKEAYFDSMTHFDFKCLLPALLHVEDRMSMAHGLESRVPLLDHPLIEFAATIPADLKFAGGELKHILKETYVHLLPARLVTRRDKMGFPVPLKEWLGGELREMLQDIFRSDRARTRAFVNSDAVLANFDAAGRFSRKTWGLLSLEIWHQQFHDRAADWRGMIDQQSIMPSESFE
jgi:asparagine synthase (glutamine-hydrolysing)